VTPHVLVVQHEDGAPLCRFRAMDGLTLDVVRPDKGDQLPSGPQGYDGMVVLGGSMAAWDDDIAPWLPATRALLAASLEHRTPTLAICLGAQLLAMAAGGHVAPGPDGPELGVVPITLTEAAEDDALASRQPRRFPAPQGHHDAIDRLPEGAVLLATSEQYPHQLYRLGDSAWGVQYHPEVDRAVFADWMDADQRLLEQQGSSRREVMAAFDAHEGELASSADRHAEAFADVVRSRMRVRMRPAMRSR
jgi:GMP synthase (glutamine-hydrolysing)